MKTALVAGSTGLVGGELIKLLIQEAYYSSVSVIVRNPTSSNHPKVKSYKVDFGKLQEFVPSEPITDVYICLGTTMKKAGSKEAFRKVDYDYVLNIARWAKENQVSSLCLISSLGVKSEKTSNFYLKTKFDTENDIIQLEIPRTFFLRPSLLLGERQEFRLAEKFGAILIKLFTPLLVGSLYKYRPVHAEKVAKAMFNYMANEDYQSAIIENDVILNLS